MSNDNGTKSLIDSGVFLGGITGLGYWLSYHYEAAYLGSYGIPSDLVEVHLENVLAVLVILFGFALVVIPFLNLIGIFWSKNVAIQNKVARIGFILLFPLWHLINYGFRNKDLKIYLVVFGIVGVFEFLWPYLVYKNRKSMQERFIADEESEEPVKAKTFWGRLFVIGGLIPYWFTVAICFGPSFSHTAANGKMARTADYFLIDSLPTMAIVRIYPDKILAVEFLPKEKLLTGRVNIFFAGNKEVIAMSPSRIGPLVRKPS